MVGKKKGLLDSKKFNIVELMIHLACLFHGFWLCPPFFTYKVRGGMKQVQNLKSGTVWTFVIINAILCCCFFVPAFIMNGVLYFFYWNKFGEFY